MYGAQYRRTEKYSHTKHADKARYTDFSAYPVREKTKNDDFSQIDCHLNLLENGDYTPLSCLLGRDKLPSSSLFCRSYQWNAPRLYPKRIETNPIA